MNDFTFSPIGLVRSCYREKFGIPRQPGLVTAARATLELMPPFARDEALAGLEGFSHLWLVFVFHQCIDQGWRSTVRPPRLGGNRRIGVFASRSGFRPNPIGLSVVELLGWRREAGRLLLELGGADLLDGTPVLDIKPYLPYADALPDARGGYAAEAPAAPLEVVFSAAALRSCAEAPEPGLETLVRQVLAQDPRPAYRAGREHGASYGMRLLDYEVRWEVAGGVARVLELHPA